MSIKYRMRKIRDYINPEGKKKSGYYPQVVRTSTVGINQLAQKAAYGTTLNEFEIEASLRLILHYIEDELLNSNHVCFEGFGTFSLSAECSPVESPDEIRAESIRVKKVVFVPSRTFMQRIRNAKFSRK